MVHLADEDPFKIIIIGAGISGITQAIELRKRLGDRVDLTIFERENEAGGVWNKARWPGASVDTFAHFYALPGEPNPYWKARYATQPEVFDYWQSLIEKYNLRPRIIFNSTVLGSVWEETKQQHRVKIRRQDGVEEEVTAHFLICASGPLSVPRRPDIPGLESFKGISFHNLEWDATVDFEGKKIAVIGNGSSAVQFVPGLAEIKGTTVTQFVRTGGYFRPKESKPYSHITQWAFAWLPGVHRIYRLYVFSFSFDARWQGTSRQIKKREGIEELLDGYLRKAAPEKYYDVLKADFPLGCKRPPMDAGWLQSLHRSNVTLISSKIIGANATGLVTADGEQHDFDIIITATGAKVATQGVGANQNIFGLGGKEVAEVWKERGGPEAFLGLGIPSHPNFLWTIGPNSTSGAWSYTSYISSKIITKLIKALLDEGLTSVAPSQAAFESHNAYVKEALKEYTVASDQCSSWYKTESGKSTMLNPESGIGHLWRTRKVNWSEWVTWTVKDNKLVQVDLSRRIWWRNVLKGTVAASLGVAFLTYKLGGGRFIA